MSIRQTLREDIRMAFERDPAARSTWEVLFCYPGLQAVWFYRLGHALWRRRWYFLGRLVSHRMSWDEIQAGFELVWQKKALKVDLAIQS